MLRFICMHSVFKEHIECNSRSVIFGETLYYVVSLQSDFLFTMWWGSSPCSPYVQFLENQVLVDLNVISCYRRFQRLDCYVKEIRVTNELSYSSVQFEL